MLANRFYGFILILILLSYNVKRSCQQEKAASNKAAGNQIKSTNNVRDILDVGRKKSSFLNSQQLLRTFIVFTYNILNSNTNFNGLNQLAATLTNLFTSNGFVGLNNAINVIANVAGTYNAIENGVFRIESRVKHEEDAYANYEFTNELKASLNDVNYQLEAIKNFLAELACRFGSTGKQGNVFGRDCAHFNQLDSKSFKY